MYRRHDEQSSAWSPSKCLTTPSESLLQFLETNPKQASASGGMKGLAVPSASQSDETVSERHRPATPHLAWGPQTFPSGRAKRAGRRLTSTMRSSFSISFPVPAIARACPTASSSGERGSKRGMPTKHSRSGSVLRPLRLRQVFAGLLVVIGIAIVIQRSWPQPIGATSRTESKSPWCRWETAGGLVPLRYRGFGQRTGLWKR